MKNINYFKEFKSYLLKKLNERQKKAIKLLTQAIKLTDKLFIKQILEDNRGYPENVSKENILNQNKKNKKLLSHYTIIKKRGAKLIAIRYEKYYEKTLINISKLITKASKNIDDEQLKFFLKERSSSLLNGDYKKSEIIWTKMNTNYPINFVIGPLLTYHDNLFSIKTYYSGLLYIRNIEKENFYKKISQKLEKDFEKILLKNSLQPKKTEIELGDVICYGGEIAKMQAIAWARPSSSTDCKIIIKKYGSKKLLFENLFSLRFKKIGLKIYKNFFEKKINEKKLLNLTLIGILLHEIGHGYAHYKNEEKRLKNFFWSFEELKSDLFALHLAKKLIDYNFVNLDDWKLLIKGLLADIFSQYKLSLTVTERKGHGFSTLYLSTKLFSDKIIEINNKKKLKINWEKFNSFTKKYLLEIQKIMSSFSYKEVKEFVNIIEKKAEETVLIKKIKFGNY